MSNRIYYLDPLRFFATVAVVLIHTSSSFYGISNSPSYSDMLFFYLYQNIGFFAVPVFVMISGALFLCPERDTSYRVLFKKYVSRIVLALIIFGLPMCLMECVFSHEPVMGAFYNFIVGHSWTHMWYLYMLICLYLLTPLLKPFFQMESRSTIEVVLLVLFVLSSLFPMFKSYGVPLESWMITGTPFIFYYILGYYLASIEQLRLGAVTCFMIFLLLPASILATFFGFLPAHVISYVDVSVVIGAAALFLLFKRLDVHWPVTTSCYPYCFAIYLVHPFFINISCKVMHLDLLAFAPSWFSVPVAFAIIFVLSFFVSWILRKIPFMKKVI